MATVAFAAFGASVAQGYGLAATSFGALAIGAASSMAGAYVDSLWINALFPPPDIKGPRVQELTIQTSDEGAPLNRVHGEAARVAGTVVWLTDLQKTKNTNSQSKGGQGGNFLTWTYSISTRVAIAQAGCEVAQIFADGKLLYDIDSVPDAVSGNDITGVAGSSVQYQQLVVADGDPAQVQATYRSKLTLSAPSGGTDLSRFVVGRPIDISGFSGAAASNNGVDYLELSKLNTDGSTTLRVVRTFSSTFDGHVGDTDPSPPASSFYHVSFAAAAYTVSIDQSLSVVGWLEKTVRSIRFYDGASTQGQDALEFAVLGSDLCPAYRGVTSIVIEGMTLTDFGNRPPIFSFVVRNPSTLTVGDAIDSEFEARGIGPEYIDTSRMTMALGGYAIRGPQSLSTILSPVMVAYNIVAREYDGRFEFYTRDDLPTYALDSDLLGASVDFASTANPLSFDTSRADTVPNEVTVNFADPENNYLTGTERAVIESAGESTIETVDLTVTMAREDAARIAKRLLWSAQVASTKYRLALPISEWGNVTESMLLTVTVNEVERSLLVQRVDRQEDGMLAVTAVEENQALYATIDGESLASTESLLGGRGTGTQFLSFGTPPLEAIVLDVAPLRDEHANKVVLYVGAGIPDDSSGWGGAALFESDDDVTFRQVATINAPTAHGYTPDSLSTWTGSGGAWDRTSSITVRMEAGELENCTDDECLAGLNRLRIGREIVGFTTATSTGTENEYTVTNLLRGLRNTERTVHLDGGEPVIVLGDGGLTPYVVNSSAIGAGRYFRVIHSGQTIDDAESVQIAVEGNSARPFSPDHLAAARDASNNVTLSWVQRTRSIARLFSGQRVPSFEPTEQYVVEVYADNTFASVVREISVDESDALYTAAQQTADGLTPGDPINVRVYQVGSVVKRGNYTEATL